MKILKELGLLFHLQKEIDQFIQFDKINETINKIKKINILVLQLLIN